jgi:hypothetical protein
LSPPNVNHPLPVNVGVPLIVIPVFGREERVAAPTTKSAFNVIS